MNPQRSAPSAGKNLNDVQEMNRSLILRLMKKNNVCSRATLAKLSGLKQATITNIINDFIEWGIVMETGFLEGDKGRRSIGIQINHKEYYVIGVRLTRNFFNVGLFDIFGQIVETKTVDNNKLSGPSSVVKKMRMEITLLLKNNIDKKIIGIGIAIPGPYFRHEGKIMVLTDFPGWDDIAFNAEMSSGFGGIPVIIDHDGNAGALAEWWLAPNNRFGGLLIYLAVGQGIGAGIVNDGRVFRGALGTAGEIGHASINMNGPECECGNRGCLNNYASTVEFAEKVRRAMLGYPDTELKPDFDFQTLIQAIKHGDSLAMDCFREVVKCLSVGVINLICAYSPDEIIIGDEMSEAGECLIDTLKDCGIGQIFKGAFSSVNVRLSSFDTDPAYIGAAALAIDYSLSHTSIFKQTGTDKA